MMKREKQASKQEQLTGCNVDINQWHDFATGSGLDNSLIWIGFGFTE